MKVKVPTSIYGGRAIAASRSKVKAKDTTTRTSRTRSSSKVKTASNSSNSGSEKFDMDAGSAGKGRYIFRKCLSCHKKKKAPVVSPGDRTKKAWDRYFTNDFRKFKRAMPQFSTYKYSVAQMEHLHQFLRKYALDADKPRTCE